MQNITAEKNKLVTLSRLKVALVLQWLNYLLNY